MPRLIHYERERILGISKLLALVPYSWDSPYPEETNWHLVICNLWINLGIKLPERFRFSLCNMKDDKCITLSYNYHGDNYSYKYWDYPNKEYEYAKSYLIDGEWIEYNYTNNKTLNYFIRSQYLKYCDKYGTEHNGKVSTYLVREHNAPRWLKLNCLKKLYSKIMDNDYIYGVLHYDGKRDYEYQIPYILSARVSTELYIQSNLNKFGGEDER